MLFLALGVVCRNRTEQAWLGERREGTSFFVFRRLNTTKKKKTNRPISRLSRGLGATAPLGPPRVSRLGNHSGPCTGHAGAEPRLICLPRCDYRDVNRPRQMVGVGPLTCSALQCRGPQCQVSQVPSGTGKPWRIGGGIWAIDLAEAEGGGICNVISD